MNEKFNGDKSLTKYLFWIISDYFCSYELWRSTFDALIYLIHEILSKLKGCAEVFIRFLKQVIELVLCCAREVEIFTDNYDILTVINEVISPAFRDVSTSMMDYIVGALAGPFGSYFKGIRWSSDQAEYEIKVLDPLLSAKVKMYDVLAHVKHLAQLFTL